MKYDQFDFEQQIMSCWNVTTDLKDLNEGVLEGNLSKDQIANSLIGIEQLYNIRFDKLFRMFEQFNSERYELLRNQKISQAQYELFDEMDLPEDNMSR